MDAFVVSMGLISIIKLVRSLVPDCSLKDAKYAVDFARDAADNRVSDDNLIVAAVFIASGNMEGALERATYTYSSLFFAKVAQKIWYDRSF